MVPGSGLHNLHYGERLRRMDLPSLMYRRLRGDVIETYKYLHGIYTGWSKKNGATLHFPKYLENY